jgi:hypothetical protein
MMNSKQRRRLALMGAFVLVVAALAVPGSAIAQDQLANPAAAQYQPQGDVLGGSASGSASTPSVSGTPTGGGNSSQIGSLPFTGMDLAIVAGVALLLTGTGLALHRLSVPPRARS